MAKYAVEFENMNGNVVYTRFFECDKDQLEEKAEEVAKVKGMKVHRSYKLTEISKVEKHIDEVVGKKEADDEQEEESKSDFEKIGNTYKRRKR